MFTAADFKRDRDRQLFLYAASGGPTPYF